MIEILGKKFISEKEASKRYGYSRSWFQRMRYVKAGPTFNRITKSSKILYPIDDTDQWFKNHLHHQA